MPRLMSLPRACPTMICSQPCQVPDTFRRLDCWSPLAKIEIVIQVPQRYSAILGLLQWLSAAVTSAGCIGVLPVPHSSARPLSSGQAQPYQDPSGPKPTIDSNAAKVALIEWRYALCLLYTSPSPRD